jgi:hypothetical protein
MGGEKDKLNTITRERRRCWWSRKTKIQNTFTEYTE